jgi:hypothetical protein
MALKKHSRAIKFLLNYYYEDKSKDEDVEKINKIVYEWVQEQMNGSIVEILHILSLPSEFKYIIVIKYNIRRAVKTIRNEMGRFGFNPKNIGFGRILEPMDIIELRLFRLGITEKKFPLFYYRDGRIEKYSIDLTVEI